jgi:hypothetical protein
MTTLKQWALNFDNHEVRNVTLDQMLDIYALVCQATDKDTAALKIISRRFIKKVIFDLETQNEEVIKALGVKK